ncbi:MAG: hypothetical protein R2784_10000 [Saprospiraceae bacterium]
MSKSKDAYRDFAEKVEVPLQLLPWWWDAICGDSWEVALQRREWRNYRRPTLSGKIQSRIQNIDAASIYNLQWSL